MDLRAKAKLVDTAELTLHVIPFEGWTCYIGSRKIIKQWQSTLQEHINGNKLHQYWQCKQRFGRGASKQVDWTSISQAMMEVWWSRRKWVTKFTSGEFPHGINMQHWHFRISSKCPQCSQEQEDKQHILCCLSELAKKCWMEVLVKLKDWLKLAKTDPQLAEAIIDRLQGWYSGEENHSASRRPPFLQQSVLGWDMFLKGGLSALWWQEQDKFWQCIKSQKSSKCWMSELIKNYGQYLGICGPL